MKLSLRNENGLAVLDVADQVSSHELSILKAGVTKLLRDGKNKIIVNLSDAKNLTGEVVRELAIIDVFARELSGKIIIASSDPALKQSIQSFPKPPVIPILASVALAAEYFSKLQEEDPEENVDVLKAVIAAKTKEIEALKQKIELLDPAEITKLRGEKAELQSRIKMLEKQVNELMQLGKNPADEEGFLEKISSLEETIKKMTQQPAKKD